MMIQSSILAVDYQLVPQTRPNCVRYRKIAITVKKTTTHYRGHNCREKKNKRRGSQRRGGKGGQPVQSEFILGTFDRQKAFAHRPGNGIERGQEVPYREYDRRS